MFNDTFYPTPKSLQEKMYAKIVGQPDKVLDPEAGKGDLLEGLNERSRHRRYDVSAIEIDPELQACLRGKKIRVIDTDFLNFQGSDRFDLIIMNPPFDHGDKHLHKALDLMFCGQVICILNAETIRNPNTRARQELVERLDKLDAEIEFHRDAFTTEDTERKTQVEIALISVVIERQIEDLFAGTTDAEDVEVHVRQHHDLSAGFSIEELVAQYDQTVRIGTETILDFYKNHHRVGAYLRLVDADERSLYSDGQGSLTAQVQKAVNKMLVSIRKDFWQRTLSIDAVSKRLTKKKFEEFQHTLNERSSMDFTASNIRQFILNIIDGYQDTLTEATEDLFDMMTDRHSYYGGVTEKNRYLYNGWKSNSSFRVKKKVVIPIYGSYGGPFSDWNGGWKLDYKAEATLNDIDRVMNFFSGMEQYKSISQALHEAFGRGESRGIHSTYFKISCYRKGTIHLTFQDEELLRRFNVCAGKAKGWLPGDYGDKEYAQLSIEEREVADSFEGRKSYEDNVGQPLFAPNKTLLIAA